VAYGGNAALVTGASSGVGEAFARALTARGGEVLLTGLPEDHTRTVGALGTWQGYEEGS